LVAHGQLPRCLPPGKDRARQAPEGTTAKETERKQQQVITYNAAEHAEWIRKNNERIDAQENSEEKITVDAWVILALKQEVEYLNKKIVSILLKAGFIN
jgi:hypothetical protein